jgi:response regulator RpfG family c-di-GMP phosphodiesterase
MNPETLPRILVVDDDRHLLDGLRRQLRAEFSVETAVGGPEGLVRLQEAGPFSVVLSDYQMPQMNGAAFLAAVRQVCPDTTRMLLTGQADLGGAAEVVNQGGVYRFLIKPVSREVLVEALHAGVEQCRRVTAERELPERTLHGSVKALTELLSLASPPAFARATRLRWLAGELLAVAGEPMTWHVDLAVMLSQVGAITLPPDVLERMEANAELTPAEQSMVSRLPALAEQVLAGVPGLEEVRDVIRGQNASYAGGPAVAGGPEISLGSRVLRVVSDYDALVAAGQGIADALQVMSGRPGAYEPRLLDALASVVAGPDRHQPRSVQVDKLESGMVLAADVFTKSGVKLMPGGHEITPSVLERIRNFSRMGSGVRQPLAVLMPSWSAVPTP